MKKYIDKKYIPEIMENIHKTIKMLEKEENRK